MTIRDAIASKGIEYLVHFTPTINLLGIYEIGSLVTRLEFDDIRSHSDGRYAEDYLDHMDDQRYDGYRDYINLSISRPNIFLLNAYKKRYVDSFYDWCVILIDPSIMADERVLFSVCNAASYSAKSYGIKPGKEGLEDLYRDEVISNGRRFHRYNTDANCPTDVQAEVLYPRSIDVSKVKKICFANSTSLALCKSAFLQENITYPFSKFEVCPSLF